MRARNFVWGTLFLIVGMVLAAGWFPGADDVATGPRIGMTMAAFTFALLILGIPLTMWFIRKTARPEDYDGGCPVGWVCHECDEFTFNPRVTCKHCGAAQPNPSD